MKPERAEPGGPDYVVHRGPHDSVYAMVWEGFLPVGLLRYVNDPGHWVADCKALKSVYGEKPIARRLDDVPYRLSLRWRSVRTARRRESGYYTRKEQEDE